MTAVAIRTPKRDRGIEGAAARYYAAGTGEMMHEFEELAQRIAGELPPGSAVLEVAPGPGYFCVELARRGSFTITGVDISSAMVQIATGKAEAAGVSARFIQASAANLPFPNDSFDFLLCRAAFKNFAQPVAALQQMCRVLKPGGRGMIIDLKRNASPKAASRYVDSMGLSTMNRIMTKLVFRTTLIRSAYTRRQFQQMLAQAGFSKTEILESEIGFEITMTK